MGWPGCRTMTHPNILVASEIHWLSLCKIPVGGWKRPASMLISLPSPVDDEISRKTQCFHISSACILRMINFLNLQPGIVHCDCGSHFCWGPTTLPSTPRSQDLLPRPLQDCGVRRVWLCWVRNDIKRYPKHQLVKWLGSNEGSANGENTNLGTDMVCIMTYNITFCMYIYIYTYISLYNGFTIEQDEKSWFPDRSQIWPHSPLVFQHLEIGSLSSMTPLSCPGWPTTRRGVTGHQNDWILWTGFDGSDYSTDHGSIEITLFPLWSSLMVKSPSWSKSTCLNLFKPCETHDVRKDFARISS